MDTEGLDDLDGPSEALQNFTAALFGKVSFALLLTAVLRKKGNVCRPDFAITHRFENCMLLSDFFAPSVLLATLLRFPFFWLARGIYEIQKVGNRNEEAERSRHYRGLQSEAEDRERKKNREIRERCRAE
jgi:hypothetical protein